MAKTRAPSKKSKPAASPAEVPKAATALDWQVALTEALSRSDMADGKMVVRLTAVADACVTAAMAGNVQAIREIASRLEAKGEAERPKALRIVHTFKSAI